jgi:hypothetical protein
VARVKPAVAGGIMRDPLSSEPTTLSMTFCRPLPKANVCVVSGHCAVLDELLEARDDRGCNFRAPPFRVVWRGVFRNLNDEIRLSRARASERGRLHVSVRRSPT